MSSRGDSRRYPTAEVYEERERDFYRGGRRGTREYEELDVDISRGRGAPDFLRDDFGRNATAGPLIVREPPPPRTREVEREEIIITRDERDRARPPPRRPRSVEREEFEIRRGDRHRRQAEKEEIDVTIEHNHGPSAPRHRHRRREVERDEVEFRRSEADLRSNRGRDEFDGRRGEVDKEEIIIRRDERTGRRHDGAEERDRISVRTRSQSRHRREHLPPPGDLVARETEEFIIRRKKPRSPSPSPSPSPPRRNFEREEIIIRRTEERSPTPPPPEPEPVMLEPIIRPPIRQEIHQEIITHHRHIDHGVERARSPIPPPQPRSPSPPKVDTLEIDIRRRHKGREFEEDITVERDHWDGGDREVAAPRPRSRSAIRRRPHDDDLEEEADYYNRKAMERAYVGEGYDGATREWAIVDVPPGTERVKMDGAGGSSQEISWQRYNGVRRSKFLAGDREFDSGFGMPDQRRALAPPSASMGPPARLRPADMWTEITKDLVIKEAILAQGYEFEETEFFYYVMEYLRYEDVLQLVEISDEIRRDRRRRVRELEWEREEMRRRHAQYDDRFYEREVIVDSRRRH